MVYESLSQIFDEMDETHARFYERAGALSAEEASARPDAGAWSVTEVIEHVSIVESSIVKLVTRLLMKAEAAGEKAREDGSIVPVSVEQIVERSQREKYQAPETAHPSGDVPIADSIARMRATREALEELRPRLEKTDLSNVSYPHPAFGPMNVYEWLILLGIHKARHLKQIETMLSAHIAS
ncbi:MAG: DinB family protein [Pyrinomonadaceae bacterium]|nr:DinB family protein [Pyrinomonadaceae bacterium]